MLKRTLYFANPYYLSTRNEQLVVQQKEKNDATKERTMPIEDIGFLVIDHPQVSISHVATQKLVANNVAVIYCDEKHLPTAMLIPFEAHQTQNERFRQQIEITEPLRKQLWQQTIIAKIENQATVLEHFKGDSGGLRRMSKQVMSGDSTNREGVAARYYWSQLFNDYVPDFQRDRYGVYPNALLNYGYAILRAAMARALAGTGLNCTLGINHHNRYNAFCLADDMMEPYRPFVDRQVAEMVCIESPDFPSELSTAHKQKLLGILAADTNFGEMTSPLMISLHRTAVSLQKCFAGEVRKLQFSA
jgi:CRISP-associated protein Cas1